MSDDGLRVVAPAAWSRARGFAYGIDGGDRRVLWVAGQLAGETGAAAPPAGMGLAEQFVRCLHNVAEVVRAAGGEPTDVAALRAFVTDMAAFKAAQPSIASGWREIFDRHFPAMTLVEVRALYEETALVEIEATAMLKKDVTS